MKKPSKLVLSEFRRWLEGLAQRSWFTCGDSTSCPLGRYLRREVNSGHGLPDWAGRFIKRFDEEGSYGDRITRDRTLEILRHVAYRRA